MPQPQIILSPTPPVQGQKLNITYTGPLPITLEIDWDPKGEPNSVTITSDAGTSIEVPKNATSVVVSDPTGAANSAAEIVVP